MIAPLSAQSPEPAALTSSGYVIDAELDTAAHHLTAKVVVSFTVPETAEPQLRSSCQLRLSSCAKGDQNLRRGWQLLTGERSADGGIR